MIVYVYGMCVQTLFEYTVTQKLSVTHSVGTEFLNTVQIVELEVFHCTKILVP